MKRVNLAACNWIITAITVALAAGCAGLPLGPGGTASKKAEQRNLQVRDDFAMEYAKGRNLENAGELEKARGVYTRLRQQRPKNANVLHRLAVVSDLQRRHTEAQKLYTHAIRLRPNNAELFNDLGYCFYLQGKLAKAESAMRKAIQLNPASPRFHINLGMAIGHQGRLQEAFAEFSQSGSAADAYYNLASVHAFRSEFEQSKVCFRKALTLDPNHRLARQSLDNFVKYEASSDEDDTLLAKQNYVPHVEGSSNGEVTTVGSAPNDGGRVQQTSHTQKLPTGPQATRATRALHRQARGMLGRNMASERKSEQGNLRN